MARSVRNALRLYHKVAAPAYGSGRAVIRPQTSPRRCYNAELESTGSARIIWLMPPITNPRPLSLYIHLPWCVRKCPYCDFNSYRATGPVPEAAYVDALLRDVDAELGITANRPVHTV